MQKMIKTLLIIKGKINNNIILKKSILYILNHFPKLKTLMQQIEQDNEDELLRKTYTKQTPQEVDQLSPSVRKIYFDLGRAIKENKNRLK